MHLPMTRWRILRIRNYIVGLDDGFGHNHTPKFLQISLQL